jgi:hypothetical protein
LFLLYQKFKKKIKKEEEECDNKMGNLRKTNTGGGAALGGVFFSQNFFIDIK